MNRCHLYTTLACLIAVIGPFGAGCHKKKAGSTSETSRTAEVEGQLVPIFSTAHPSACEAELVQPFASVQGCNPAGSGDRHDSEGECFVEDTIVPAYNQEPPTSGPQYTAPVFPPPQFRDDVVPRGTYMRNLAHGFIVIIYNCPAGTCDAEIAAIRALWEQPPAPLAGIPLIMTKDPLYTKHRFAALSWTWSLEFDALDAGALTCFAKQHGGFGLSDYVDGKY